METLHRGTVASLLLILVVLKGRPSHCQPYSQPKLTQQPSTSIYYFSHYGSQTPTFSLPCQANGTQPLTYRWERNGKTVFQTNNSSRNESLVLMSASKADIIGNYTCFATNYLGTAVSNTARVQFAFLNNFNDDTKNYNVSEGSWLRLACDAPDGQPAPAISWTRDGQPVFVNGSSWDPDRKMVQDRAGGLVLLNASLSDSGPYVCEVQSPAIPAAVYSREIEVVVEETTVGVPLQPPEILEWAPVVEALVGEDVKLYCLAVGNPTPSVRWSRQHYPSFQAAEGAVLTVRNVQLDHDDGDYTCTAWSTNGREVNQTTALHIEAAPYWIVKPKDTTVYKGKGATMSCQAGGKPEPDIKWMENGVHKPEYDGASSVLMNNVTMADRKVYQCTASNVHGQIMANAILDVTEHPRVSPSGIRVSIQSRESVLISWNPIDDDRLTGFKVRYQRSDSIKPKRKDCYRESSCILKHLKRNAKFYFRVVAVYNNGSFQNESDTYSFNLAPKDTYRPYRSPTLWNLFNTALYCVIVLGVSTPLIMCIILCIRDQINGYEPDDEDEDDGWGGRGNNTPKVEKVKTVKTVARQQHGAGAGPSQSNANHVV
ncbi:contactin-5-like [Patiria miniata]|uniref:Uncharacterized protein n=1 Tax=Patiria miniata TaxID=46514 RepID=A0A913ZS45_PATMI|nr:contactin-5-like [Patiria miniata]